MIRIQDRLYSINTITAIEINSVFRDTIYVYLNCNENNLFKHIFESKEEAREVFDDLSKKLITI